MRMRVLVSVLIVCVVILTFFRISTYQEHQVQRKLEFRLTTELQNKTQRNQLDPAFAKIPFNSHENDNPQLDRTNNDESENKKMSSLAA